MAMLNYLTAEMDALVGFGPSPRLHLPVLPQFPNGPMSVNNIKVDNSTVGAINTGIVKELDVSLRTLGRAGNEEAKKAIEDLVAAISQADALDVDQKNEAMEQVAFLSAQAAAPKSERKPGMVKATMAALGQLGKTATNLATAWNAAAPILHGLFGAE
jgi:hypothetical protein